MALGIDRAPVFQDQVELTVQAANDSAVGTVRGVIVGHPFVLTGPAIEQVVIDKNVWILVVGKVVVKVRFAIGILGSRHPCGSFFGDRAVMNPVDHVFALPGVVTTQSRLQSTGGIELIRKLGCLQRNVETVERCRFRLEGRQLGRIAPFSAATVTAKHPVVVRAEAEHHRCVAEIHRTKIVGLIPIGPFR